MCGKWTGSYCILYYGGGYYNIYIYIPSLFGEKIRKSKKRIEDHLKPAAGRQPIRTAANISMFAEGFGYLLGHVSGL